VERLESRYLAGSLQPTDQEQLFLELLNAARADPAAYGISIGLDLSDVAASQPMAFNLVLVEAARLHSQDMNDRRFFGHANPDGEDPGDRMTASDYDWTAYAESIAAGFDTPAEALSALIIDEGIPDLGHRKHLLAIDDPGEDTLRSLDELGIGIVLNGTGPYRHYYTIDSARDHFTAAPYDAFLTGVIYTDLDENDLYSPGEGYPGITVHAVGPADVSVTSFDTGGYSLPLPPGTYTVTATGFGLPDGGLSAVVTMGTSNVKLDFTVPVGGGGGGPDEAELAVWSGYFQIDRNGNGTWDGPLAGDRSHKFGSAKRDVPVPIDWNGDGVNELAVFRRGKTLMVDSNGDFDWDGKRSDTKLVLGNGGDQAIVGDWNGDGTHDIGLLRNETGMFHLDTNGDRLLDASDAQFQFPVQAGDIAVAGDWDGNGQHEVGLFRGGNSFLLDSNGDRAWDAAVDTQITLPVAAAQPAPTDYDGDGQSEMAVFTVDTFQIDTNHDGTLDSSAPFTAGRYPAAGNWV
jgi:uncharacterized protein YkwD